MDRQNVAPCGPEQEGTETYANESEQCHLETGKRDYAGECPMRAAEEVVLGRACVRGPFAYVSSPREVTSDSGGIRRIRVLGTPAR